MNRDKLKIGFLARYNPEDRAAWSGLGYQLYKSLTRIVDVEVIWVPIRAFHSKQSQLYKDFIDFRLKLYGRNVYYGHIPLFAKHAAMTAERNKLDQVDVIFAPDSFCVAYLETNKPIIYLTDATFKSTYNYYPRLTNYLKENIKGGNDIEQRTLDKSADIVSSSEWAKLSMISDYSTSTDKIHVIEFGANLDKKEIPTPNIKKHKIDDELQILFLGVEWERKGGDIAVGTVEELNKKGIKARLHVAGLDLPENHKGKNFITE